MGATVCKKQKGRNEIVFLRLSPFLAFQAKFLLSLLGFVKKLKVNREEMSSSGFSG